MSNICKLESVRVHLIGMDGKEIVTRNMGTEFPIYIEDGVPGICWTNNKFSSFNSFTESTVFEDVNNENFFRWKNGAFHVLQKLSKSDAKKWISENTTLMQDTLMLDFECLAFCVKHSLLQQVGEWFVPMCTI